jgi:hypothetical protein
MIVMSTHSHELQQAAQALREWLATAQRHYEQFGAIPDPGDGKDAVRLFLDVLREDADAKGELARRGRFADDPGDAETDYVVARGRGLEALRQVAASAGPSPTQRAVDNLRQISEKRPSLGEVTQEYARLGVLLAHGDLVPSVRQSLVRWRDEAWAIVSLGKRMAAEGCRWLATWKSSEGILDTALGGPVLPDIAVAVELLVAWCNEKAVDLPREAAPHSTVDPKVTINDRMQLTLFHNPEAAGWSVRQWADHLRCSPSTVHGTRQWKALQAAHAMVKVARLEQQERARGFDRKGTGRRFSGRHLD